MNDQPRWLGVASVDGVTRFRVGREGDEMVAEWTDQAKLVASADGARHELTFAGGVGHRERHKLERGAARILLRQLQGHVGFHGSAVLHENDGLVFVGTSGQGKSTLAAALCKRGCRLVADDAVALAIDGETLSVLPTDTEHWLDRASCEALGIHQNPDPRVKLAVAPRSAQNHAAQLTSIIELAWITGPSPRLRRISGVAALARLLPHVVRFVIDSPAHQRREFEQLELLVTRIPVYVLERPRRFDALDDTLDILMNLRLKGTRHGE